MLGSPYPSFHMLYAVLLVASLEIHRLACIHLLFCCTQMLFFSSPSYAISAESYPLFTSFMAASEVVLPYFCLTARGSSLHAGISVAVGLSSSLVLIVPCQTAPARFTAYSWAHAKVRLEFPLPFPHSAPKALYLWYRYCRAQLARLPTLFYRSCLLSLSKCYMLLASSEMIVGCGESA